MALISESYRQLQSDLHQQREDYGVASIHFAPMISKLINTNSVKEMLDYGAGKGRLAEHLQLDGKIDITMYDPAIPDFAAAPEPRELVCCVDVLEHIELENLDEVLNDLERLTKRIGFFTVGTEPAKKTLADGRNAHLIQETAEWWLPKFLSRFNLNYFSRIPNGFLIIVRARNK